MDRIGELHVRVTTDIAGRDEELRRGAEAFSRAVLERLGELLERRVPGRLIVLRELPLRWRIVDGGMEDAAQIEQFAEALADSVEGSLPPPVDLPPPDADAVAFEDEGHQIASFLLARAHGRVAWFHAAATRSGEPFETLALPENQERAVVVLARLARAGGAADALAAAPRASVARLATALGVDARAAGLGAGTIDQATVDRLRSVRADWPALDEQVERVALFAHALPVGPGRAPSREAIGEARRAAVAVAALSAPAGAPIVRPAPPPEPAVAPPPPAATGAAPPPERAPAQDAPPPIAAEPELVELVDGQSYDTRFAGLFYLLTPLLELGAGELLWQACLPEREVLAHAATALLSAGDPPAADPAVRMFAGAAASRPFPDVDPAQHQEVVLGLTRALAAALPRRGLAKLPPVVVSVAPHPRGRMLVATAQGSAFAFFTWPAAAPADLNRGLDALLSTWPVGAPLLGAGAVASLAPGGRLRPCPPGPDPFLPDGGSPAGTALLAGVIGAPCQLFLSRAGDDPIPSPADHVRKHLTGAARAQLLPRELHIHRGANDVDLSLRRPGLDRDPGWIPWLDRTVRVYFGE